MFATALIAGVPGVDLSLLFSFLQTLFSFLSLISSMEDNDMTNSMLVGSGARSGPNCWGTCQTLSKRCVGSIPTRSILRLQKSSLIFLPPVPTLHLDPRIAQLVRQHKFPLVIRPVLYQHQLIVYLLYRTQCHFLRHSSQAPSPGPMPSTTFSVRPAGWIPPMVPPSSHEHFIAAPSQSP